MSRLSEEEVVRQFYLLLRHIAARKEDLINQDVRRRVVDLCRGVDLDDAPHVALTLSVEGRLWTGDETLKRGLRSQGFQHFYEPDL